MDTKRNGLVGVNLEGEIIGWLIATTDPALYVAYLESRGAGSACERFSLSELGEAKSWLRRKAGGADMILMDVQTFDETVAAANDEFIYRDLCDKKLKKLVDRLEELGVTELAEGLRLFL